MVPSLHPISGFPVILVHVAFAHARHPPSAGALGHCRSTTKTIQNRLYISFIEPQLLMGISPPLIQ